MSIERDLRRAIKGSATPTDPYWANVSFLTNTFSSGPTNDRTIVDATGNTTTFTYGTYTRLSARSPFTGTIGSFYNIGNSNFAGGIKTGANTNVNFTGDFTVECWAMVPSGTTQSGYPSPIISPANYGFFAHGNVANKWSCASYGTPSFSFPSTVTSNDGVWRHLALVRNGTGTGNLKFYLDGVQIGSAASTNATFSWSTFNIGCGTGAGPGAGDNQFFGYLANMRFSNIARYTSTFTPATANFTVDANTKFLCTFLPAYADVGPNKLPILQTATTIVQDSTIKKFASLNSIRNSGSAISYFGQPTSSANFRPVNTTFTFTGDFTIECWVYVASGTTQNATSFILAGGTIISLYTNRSGASNVFSCVVNNLSINTTVNSKDSAWHHVALVRSGAGANNTVLYIDGVSAGSTSTGTTSLNIASAVFMGNAINETLIGYVDEFRITKGVARYTTTFAVPTQPFPTS